MRLILSYIPCSSEFSQKNHLKQISEIMRNFFEKKIKKENNKKSINNNLFYTKAKTKNNMIIK